MARIALNGLGRIGKLVLRDLIDSGAGGDLVLLNDPAGDAEQHALLMEFDSVHGRWRTPVSHMDGALVLNGTRVRLTHEKTLDALPLADLGIDLVIDCTGVFKTAAKVAPYFAAGVKKVVVSAPVKDGGALNLVYGVNHQLYDPASHHLITAASCTTNCLAPVVKVIHEGIGIRHGAITTIHDVTNTQTIVDRPAKDMRRARSALLNLIPTTTGSAPASAGARAASRTTRRWLAPCCASSLATRPPTSRLEARIAAITRASGTPKPRSFTGSTTTLYCRTKPPTLATSATPSALARPKRMYQSCSERSSASERLAPTTAY